MVYVHTRTKLVKSLVLVQIVIENFTLCEKKTNENTNLVCSSSNKIFSNCVECLFLVHLEMNLFGVERPIGLC